MADAVAVSPRKALGSETKASPLSPSSSTAYNPFALPSNEDDLVDHYVREQEALREQRQTLRNMKVSQRGMQMTATLSRRAQLADSAGEEEEDGAEAGAEVGGGMGTLSQPFNQTSTLNRSKAGKGERDISEELDDLAVKTRDRRVEKDLLADYIAKKREMFLVKYALDVKKQEIRKLEDVALQEEGVLDDAEKKLELDAAKFDEFLKENDKNAVDAIKRAEGQTKLKQERIAEIKRLQSDIMALTSDCEKLEDTLTRMQNYRRFLALLSPKEWIEETKKEEAAARSRLGAAASTESRVANASSSLHVLRPESAKSRTASMRKQRAGRESSARHRRRGSLSGTDFEGEGEDRGADAGQAEESSLLPPKLFFSDPKQLLEIFTELEEQNLSLIRNGQETEEALQVLEDAVALERGDIEEKLSASEKATQKLLKEIAEQEKRTKDLQDKCAYFNAILKSKNPLTAEEQEIEMRALDKKVEEVYTSCIGENEAGISTLQMLTNIENKLEELFEKMEKIPADQLASAEKAKDKERRLRLREEKLEAQRKHQEEKVRRALERAQEAPKKETGRRLVFRSVPPARKKVITKADTSKEEEEMRYYFS